MCFSSFKSLLNSSQQLSTCGDISFHSNGKAWRTGTIAIVPNTDRWHQVQKQVTVPLHYQYEKKKSSLSSESIQTGKDRRFFHHSLYHYGGEGEENEDFLGIIRRILSCKTETSSKLLTLWCWIKTGNYRTRCPNLLWNFPTAKLGL